MVALDLDDTLLDPGLKISDDCIRLIQEVRQRGVMITISTGRMYPSALPYALQLGIDVPLITYQGACVKNSLSGEVLYFKPVPADPAREVIEFFQGCGVHCHSYLEDRLVMEALTEEGRFYSRLAGVEVTIVDDLIGSLARSAALKIMAISNQESKLLEMENGLKARYGNELHITRSKPHFLEVMHPEADKAKALEVVASHYMIKRDEVMAIGDSYNDLEMIEWAGVGVAMGNAVQAVKDAADHITSSNEEEGVAEALRRFF
ncbi:MAG: Cof-type HAD-IIB family hydrolase [Syntrophomonadaceae bacterium]|nr:Cof-type HAD-IIB family hydrolase [Syntrophomonadaceae bacterium]